MYACIHYSTIPVPRPCILHVALLYGLLTFITASLTTAANIQPFLAQSPPAWDAHMASTPQQISSPLTLDAGEERFSDRSTGRIRPAEAPASSDSAPDKYVSKIGILASSLPYYHNQYMEMLKQNKEAERKRRTMQAQGEPLEPYEVELFSKFSLDAEPKEQSLAEQEEASRRLKPHSRSTLQLQWLTSQPREKPETPDQAVSKKHRTRWQFGIRSRNLPHEAIHCVYKALAAQKAQWEVPKPSSKPPNEGPKMYPGLERFQNDKSNDQGTKTPQAEDYMYNFNVEGVGEAREKTSSASSTTTGTARDDESSDDEDVDPNVIPEDYIPKDPWCIKVRWLKDGMYPPGTIHPSSAHSSRLDLSNEASRRTSMIGSMSSATASTTSVGASATTAADGACHVYMDVQLYTLEATNDKGQGTFLVDFKCAGYESVVEKVVSETEKKLVGSGVRVKDKDVTSPQPFLDLTNKLVIHLAGGGN